MEKTGKRDDNWFDRIYKEAMKKQEWREKEVEMALIETAPEEWTLDEDLALDRIQVEKGINKIEHAIHDCDCPEALTGMFETFIHHQITWDKLNETKRIPEGKKKVLIKDLQNIADKIYNIYPERFAINCECYPRE